MFRENSPSPLVQSNWSKARSGLPCITACMECPIMSIPAGAAIANCACSTASQVFFVVSCQCCTHQSPECGVPVGKDLALVVCASCCVRVPLRGHPQAVRVRARSASSWPECPENRAPALAVLLLWCCGVVTLT